MEVSISILIDEDVWRSGSQLAKAIDRNYYLWIRSVDIGVHPQLSLEYNSPYRYLGAVKSQQLLAISKASFTLHPHRSSTRRSLSLCLLIAHRSSPTAHRPSTLAPRPSPLAPRGTDPITAAFTTTHRQSLPLS